MTGPLDGIRVIDLTMWVQGPIAGTLLADLGADVIKLEKAGQGDPARNLQSLFGIDMRREGSATLLWAIANRNKRALALDLRHPEARPVFEQLVAGADVFLTNLQKDALVTMGADEGTVRAVKPDIIYAHALGFGSKGPWGEAQCQDTIGMAYGGLLFTASHDGETPYYPPGALSDVLSGTMLAFGAVAALLGKERRSGATQVETSQLQSLLWLQSMNLAAAANLGTPFAPSDRQNAPNPMFNTYRCGDGRWLALGMPTAILWPELCRSIGRDDLLGASRFPDAGAMFRGARDVIVTLDQHFANAPAGHWIERMRVAGLMVAPVNRIEDLVEDEQVRANGYVMGLEDGWKAVTSPFTMAGHVPASVAAPEHGQHTDAVLAELGLSEDEIIGLKAAGAAW